MGTALVAQSSYATALGSGLIAGAVSATAVYRINPLTKGLIVVLPEAEAEKELEAGHQTIIK